MEFKTEIKKIDRKDVLQQWLTQHCGLRSFSLQAMPSDASARRYFRLHTNGSTSVVMDAPSLTENSRAYVAIANALRLQGLNTPHIIDADLEQGFLLLTDFGDLTYLNALNVQNADSLYHRALFALTMLKRVSNVQEWVIPLFTGDLMWQEWMWHKEWFLGKLLQLSVASLEKDLDACFARIITSALSEPQVFMHRDYHSRNLMVLADKGVGVLDFQDAFIGPLTYDVVSLLRDCYIDWPIERVEQWMQHYWQMIYHHHVSYAIDFQEFLRMCDWMGIERHLKALFTFARKALRDHEPRYLKDIPRTLYYVISVSRRYPELAALHEYFMYIVQPAFHKVQVSALCVL